ncbi:MAG: hypothetical protein WCC41_00260, partial [Rhodomicrobium sp.]
RQAQREFDKGNNQNRYLNAAPKLLQMLPRHRSNPAKLCGAERSCARPCKTVNQDLGACFDWWSQ